MDRKQKRTEFEELHISDKIGQNWTKLTEFDILYNLTNWTKFTEFDIFDKIERIGQNSQNLTFWTKLDKMDRNLQNLTFWKKLGKMDRKELNLKNYLVISDKIGQN